ncbi:7a752764-6e00-4ad9-8d37-52d2b62a8f68 [Thermothielavioides terrestris]|uniref:7a752764-6e00-4ad9-8d37-52d2b62a8f68 n=1 Tax=Thermothielavioides terrestris TaxID=2587410 RepID=A0A446BAL9_9PEZI|nr:7a752764-6e00-4ad9-8d37-52d2b62a8f68 [Thermothielavioides terrestris]
MAFAIYAKEFVVQVEKGPSLPPSLPPRRQEGCSISQLEMQIVWPVRSRRRRPSTTPSPPLEGIAMLVAWLSIVTVQRAKSKPLTGYKSGDEDVEDEDVEDEDVEDEDAEGEDVGDGDASTSDSVTIPRSRRRGTTSNASVL